MRYGFRVNLIDEDSFINLKVLLMRYTIFDVSCSCFNTGGKYWVLYGNGWPRGQTELLGLEECGNLNTIVSKEILEKKYRICFSKDDNNYENFIIADDEMKSQLEKVERRRQFYIRQ